MYMDSLQLIPINTSRDSNAAEKSIAANGKIKMLIALPLRWISAHKRQWDSVHDGEQD